MESTYRKYKDRGLRILAFPANDFLGQEPDGNEKIKAYCTSTFGVTFDMFAKVSVKGANKCDLYKYLTDKKADHGLGGAVKWNFQKYLVDREGKVVAKFSPRTMPDDPKVTEVIERALGNAE